MRDANKKWRKHKRNTCVMGRMNYWDESRRWQPRQAQDGRQVKARRPRQAGRSIPDRARRLCPLCEARDKRTHMLLYPGVCQDGFRSSTMHVPRETPMPCKSFFLLLDRCCTLIIILTIFYVFNFATPLTKYCLFVTLSGP